MWALIRAFFLKGGTLEEGIKLFAKTNKGITKSDGQKLINIFEDVKKNTATVTDLRKFKDKKGIKSIPVNEQFTKTQAQDFQTFGKEVIEDLNAPIKPDLEVVSKLSKKERILKIDDELEKLSTGEGKYSTMSRNDRDNLMIKLQDESSTLQDKTLFKDSSEAIAKIKAENKAAAKRLRDKKIKSKEPVGLFANEEEFAEDLYSSTQNFIKNDPQFNLELAKTFQRPGVKTYGWTTTGDKSKLLSPPQRQKKLDRLKEIMHHEEYQHQFGESLLDEDGVSILIEDLFRIEKASGGLAREKFGRGYLVGGAKSLGKKYKGSTLQALLENPRLLGAELGHDGIASILSLFGFSEGGRARVGYAGGKKVDLDRRMILKGLGALAALPVVGKFFKLAKPLAKTRDIRIKFKQDADFSYEGPESGWEGGSWLNLDFVPLTKKGTKILDDLAKNKKIEKSIDGKETYYGVANSEDGLMAVEDIKKMKGDMEIETTVSDKVKNSLKGEYETTKIYSGKDIDSKTILKESADDLVTDPIYANPEFTDEFTEEIINIISPKKVTKAEGGIADLLEGNNV
jgi:hypothetical protein